MLKNKNLPAFTHLHVHSCYSIGQGLSTPAEICAFTKLAGFGSAALTDSNSTMGFMEFHREAKKLEIKPIYGTEVIFSRDGGERKNGMPLILIAVSREGLRNLTILSSLSGYRCDNEKSLNAADFENHRIGMIAVFPAVSTLGYADSESNMIDEAQDTAFLLKEIFGDGLFCEVRADDSTEGRLLAETCIELAAKADIRPLLMQDVRYVGREKRNVFDLIKDVFSSQRNEDFFAGDPERGEKGMRTLQEIYAFHDIFPKAYENTAAIDRLVPRDLLDEFTKEIEDIEHPAQSGGPSDAEKLFSEKVIRRFNLYFHNIERSRAAGWKNLLEKEIALIKSEGLAGNLLLFHEIISALKQQKVQTGPATGLSVQSLCAYLLDITAFNPYGFDENFKPQFDPESLQNKVLEIQIATEDRESAVRALMSLVDRKYAAYVPSIERLTPVRALKAVARKVDMQEEELGDLLKIIVQQPGISLMRLCGENKPLGVIFKKSAKARELITGAALLEGLPSGFIKSKRSLVLSPKPLRDFLGVFPDHAGGDLFIQATRESFPIGGLFRIDFTPLAGLSVCLKIEREMRKQRVRVRGWEDLPKNDETVWNAIQKGKAAGIYLMDRSHVQKQCEAFGPQSIGDLTDFLALMRLRIDEKSFSDKIEEFKSRDLPDCDYKPELMAVLVKIGGMILYDEQLEDILSALTGLSHGEASQMLKRFAATDPGLLSTLRKEFMRYAANEDIPMEEAKIWFEKIIHHLPRTISRQRVLADAMLVYKMFYLKVHYPAHFYLSLLNTYWDNEAKVKKYLAYLHDLDMLLPFDINKSELYFTLEGNKIRLGLHMIEAIDYPVLLHILNARTGRKKFRTIEDFIKKTKTRGVGMEETGKLIMAGAFDFTGISRTNMINALPELYEGQGYSSTRPLRDQLELPFENVRHVQTSGSDLMDMLIKDKHPGAKSGIKKEFAVLSSLEEFYKQKSSGLIEIAGRVSNIQRFKTSSGKIVGFFVLFDFSAFVHVFIPWARFGQFSSEMEEGKRIIVRGRVSMRDDKKICEALAIKSFEEGALEDDEKGPDEPAKRNP